MSIHSDYINQSSSKIPLSAPVSEKNPLRKTIDKVQEAKRFAPPSDIDWSRGCWPQSRTITQEKNLKFRSDPKVKPYNKEISSCAKKGDWRAALKIFHEIENVSLKPDVYSYSALIKAYVVSKKVDIAYEIFVKMQIVDVKPNLITFNTLIDGFCNAGNIEKARETITLMENESIKPTISTFNSLLKGFCKKDDFKSALTLFQALPSKGVERDTITFTTMIDAYFKVGNLQSALKFFYKMEEAEVEGNHWTYNTLIHGFINENDLHLALQFLQIMKSKDLDADKVTCNILIQGLVNKGLIDEAKKLYREELFPLQIKEEDGYPALDCHFLSHGSAYIQLLLFLEIHECKTPLIVITGKGNHQRNKKYAMKNYLADRLPRGWKISEDFQNPGMLILYPPR